MFVAIQYPAGFMGRLVTKQLDAHRDRMAFTFALGARSKTKLAALVSELDINAQVPILEVDLTSVHDVERAVKSSKVVINTVGPFWKSGTHVVRYAYCSLQLSWNDVFDKSVCAKWDSLR